jgi:type IV pilus assembly protein PilA
MKIKNKKAGFTLIEILVVIGIIAVLATIVIVAINPARQFAQARNTQRTSNLNTILNAVGQNLADNKGVALSATTCTGIGAGGVPTVNPMNSASGRTIGTPGSATVVDLSCLVPTYVTSIPIDPTNGTATDTKYTIQVDANGRYSVCAPNSSETALGSPAVICVTR